MIDNPAALATQLAVFPAADQERFNEHESGRGQRSYQRRRLCGREGVPCALVHEAIVELDHGHVSQAGTLAVSAACR